jgi:hypothetical protein
MGNSEDHKARFFLILLLLLGIVGAVLPLFLPEPARLQIVVRDGVFGTRPSGRRAVLVDLRDGDTIDRLVIQRDEEDLIGIGRVRSGAAQIQLTVEGYLPMTLDLELVPLELNRAAVNLEPSFGRVLVNVVDARRDEARYDARLTVDDEEDQERRGTDIELFLPPGEHKLTGSAPGFCSVEHSLTVAPKADLTLRLPISPELGPNEAARLILDWAENPRDLDAHVLFSGENVDVLDHHVYFGKKQGATTGGPLFAELDVDYQRSEGFETMTIYREALGVYQYFVHHFAGDGILGTSVAQVELVTEGCKRRRYSVPESCRSRWWYVVDVKVDEGEVTITERDSCSDEEPARWGSSKKS